MRTEPKPCEIAAAFPTFPPVKARLEVEAEPDFGIAIRR